MRRLGLISSPHPSQRPYVPLATRFRALEVLKMRGTRPNEKLCPFEFVDGAGIRVYPGEAVFYDVKDE